MFHVGSINFLIKYFLLNFIQLVHKYIQKFIEKVFVLKLD